jgi:hypothetical protein
MQTITLTDQDRERIDRELDTMTAGTFLTPEQAARQVERSIRTGEDRFLIRPRILDTYGVWDTEEGEYLADANGNDYFTWMDARNLQQEYVWS